MASQSGPSHRSEELEVVLEKVACGLSEEEQAVFEIDVWVRVVGPANHPRNILYLQEKRIIHLGIWLHLHVIIVIRLFI